MTAPVAEKYETLIDGGLTLERRFGTPEDVAAVVAALAAGDIPYSTGQILTVDGGLTIERL
jgi:NAD(P)-dependent dehydrogenase (short-subunit alcohol dehydrogenase family)